MNPFENISADQFETMLNNEQSILLDVRNPDEFEVSKIGSAHLIPFESPDFIAEMSEFDPTENYLIYCKSGARGSKACLMLRTMGFTGKLYNLQGGIESWNSRNKF
jgi:rhodanese-related sulfurtransferase